MKLPMGYPKPLFILALFIAFFASSTSVYAQGGPPAGNSYTVTFDKQSGTGGSDSVTATIGQPMPAADVPTLDGYDFGGYFTETAGGGTQYYTATMSSARDWDIEADTILYAKWMTWIDPETPIDSQPLSGGSDWALAFSDEFNGNTLNTDKWGIDVSTKSRAPRTDRGIADWWWVADNVSLDGAGNLVLTTSKYDADTMYCGSVSSDGKYEPTYGYLEARIQIADSTKDTHTAFWLQGENMGNVDGTGNDGAEVDIFESAWFGDYTKAVVHIDGYGADHQASTKRYDTPNLHTGYHVFGLEWTAASMKIYYNGTHKVTYTGIWVPWVAEYLWLSTGASFGDIGTFSTDPIGFLTSAKVDYVRVWQKDN